MKIGQIDLGKYPILLAPMEDVTDPAFRLMCKRFGALPYDGKILFRTGNNTGCQP